MHSPIDLAQLEELASLCRRRGVASVAFGAEGIIRLTMQAEQPLDTEPAPPPEEKPPDACAFGDCTSTRGYRYAPKFCAEHGRDMMGVI